MSILYTTGPVQLYVATPPSITNSGYGAGLTQLLTQYSASSVYYLGTCLSAPQIEISPKYKELISDLNGGALPFDVAWCGEDVRITLLLNRWNEWVYKMYAARPVPSVNSGGSGGTRGTYAASDVGRLLLHEARAVCLWAQFPYYTKYGDGSTPLGFGQPQGYRFIATWATLDAIMGGSQAGKRLLQLQAVPVYNPADGTWKLFDENMTTSASSPIPTTPPYAANGAIV